MINRQLAFADESIHDQAGFILTALVFPAIAVDASVDSALSRAGLLPGIDEYKSSARMAAQPALQKLRSEIRNVLLEADCKFALVISDKSERTEIALQLTWLVEAMIVRGRFEGRRLDLFLDGGMRTNHAAAEWRRNPVLRSSRLYPGQDSRAVRGLQLADMVAHCAATILLSDLGLVRKSFPAGEGTAFEPEQLLELEYTLWSDLRHGLASSELAYPDPPREPTPFDQHDAFGLFVSDRCSATVRAAALHRFADVYLGCIL
ncbi:hypothetical protein BH10PSE5_BH10PSE5_05360 [soil metagenome]